MCETASDTRWGWGRGLAVALAVLFGGMAAWAEGESERGLDLDSKGGAFPVRLEPVNAVTADGPLRGWLATVDLSDPRVDVVVSDIDGDDDLDDADVEIVEGAEVVLTPMDDFVNRTGVALAINANFFAWKEDGEGNKTQADVIGLSVSDGVSISDGRRFGTEDADPVLVFRKGRASAVRLPVAFGHWDEVLAKQPIDAVAGIGPSDTSAVPGTLLVKDGENLGETARVAPTQRHPRTAAGVSEDGKTLYVLVIDGRQLGHSVGATLPEMADLLIAAGADDAVALDGGGSSCLVGRVEMLDGEWEDAADPDGDGWVTNRPSDGRYRAIANQLGIRVRGFDGAGDVPAYVPGGRDVFSVFAESARVGSDVVQEDLP